MARKYFCINWIADLNHWVDDFDPIPLLVLRIFSALSLCTAFIFLLVEMLSCAVIHKLDLVHRHVTVGKSIVTLHLGTFGYCLDDHCYRVSSKSFFYTIHDEKILAQIKHAPSILKFATVVNFAAFVCAFLALVLGLFLYRFAKLFARLGAGFASAAFLFDTFFAICNPGGGLSFGIAFITFAMVILQGFAIVPVLFIAGPREMEIPTKTIDEEEKDMTEQIWNRFEWDKGRVASEEIRERELMENLLRARGYFECKREYERIKKDKKKGKKSLEGFEIKSSQAVYSLPADYKSL